MRRFSVDFLSICDILFTLGFPIARIGRFCQFVIFLLGQRAVEMGFLLFRELKGVTARLAYANYYPVGGFA